MRASVLFSGMAAFFALAGCETSGTGGTSQTGGVTTTGGQQQPGGEGGGSGGVVGSSGTTNSSSATASAGTPSTGGATATGGTRVTGETTGVAGATGAGGAATSSTSSGGRPGTGGVTASGGATVSGGTPVSGGTAVSGGRTGAGGTSTTTTSGGRGGGVAGASGTATGGAAAGGSTGPCTEPDKVVTSGSGKYCGYSYENWVGSGSATMTLKTDGFSVNWTGSTQFVGREGIRPGSANLVIDYNATFTPNGNSYLCVYGWTTSPLVEYYVVDSWGTYKPPGGSSLGTVTTDGGTYDIYKSTRTNQPSIQGTATFPQYWSVRQQKKTSGTITLANHITAWAGKSMPMGTFYEVSMTVEGYNSSGTADVKFTIK
jgi:endo-1,4-beta-xylanase